MNRGKNSYLLQMEPRVKTMKIAICTTPIRPEPTTYPPFGSMAVVQSLRKIGENVDFYDIDFHRFTIEEIESYFKCRNFEIVGISAVVSTAYLNTKSISEIIRRVSPQTLIVCGGNLAASSEILLRKTDVDICVIGDGEITFRELVAIAKEQENFFKVWRSSNLLSETKGLAFLDSDRQFVFTGFRHAPEAEEIESPDFSILKKSGSLDYFIYPVIGLANTMLGQQSESYRETTVISAKGCVARCTFCHRFERGYRVRPIEQLKEHIQDLYDTHNVRSISFGDENFGSNRELTRELAQFLGKIGIRWNVAGVRARTVTAEDLLFWKMHGCHRAVYGVESGSESILKIMQKGTTRQQNFEAMRWVSDAGMTTTLQYVIGMPGESDRTIDESIEFAIQTSSFYCYPKSLPSLNLSINYAQALPGTPLYEFARENGYLGSTLESEEEYLIKISDLDAYSSDHFINYTGLPLLKVLMWRYRMIGMIDSHFIQHEMGISLTSFEILRSLWSAFISAVLFRFGKHRLDQSSPLMKKLSVHLEEAVEHSAGYFNISKGAQFSLLYFGPIKKLSYPLMAIFVAWNQSKSILGALELLGSHLVWSVTRRFRSDAQIPARSLRKSIDVMSTTNKLDGSIEMVPIRLGR